MEGKSIINIKQTDTTLEPLFFGAPLSIQRYDRPKYPAISKLFDTQLGYFWRPEEIDLGGKERNDFKNLTDNERKIFTKNLGYQIVLDSVQSRGIANLLEDCSNPEVEQFAKAWEFMETVHSYSYTYIIKNVYSDPTETLDSITNDPEIIKRTQAVTKYYDELIDSMGDSEYDRKKKLYLTLMSINILEGIRFYVSFACSYAFAETKRMIGNADIIRLINRDENLHLGFSQFILRELRTNDKEGFKQIVEECEPIVIQMFKDAAQEESEWAEYLFSDGAILGLNETILKQYMQYLTNTRMKAIGLEPVFGDVKNPIPWINDWISSKNTQAAPQEKEITSYIVGGVKSDDEEEDYSDFL